MMIFLQKLKNLTLTTNQLLFFTCCYIALILNLPFLTKATNAITALDDYNIMFLISLPVFLLSLTVISKGDIVIIFAFDKFLIIFLGKNLFIKNP